MSNAAKMVIDDLSKFQLLTEDMKKQMIKGGYNTVATMAGKVRKEAINGANRNFTMWNNFSTKNIVYSVSDFKPYMAISEIEAKVGATERAPWMARLEEGGTQKPTKGDTLAIPTDVARGGNPAKLVKKKIPRCGYTGRKPTCPRGDEPAVWKS